MTYKELVDYMRAVANAENMLYFCTNAQEELQQHITENQNRPVPAIEQYLEVSYAPSWYYCVISPILDYKDTVFNISYFGLAIWFYISLFTTITQGFWNELIMGIAFIFLNVAFAFVLTLLLGIVAGIVLTLAYPFVRGIVKNKIGKMDYDDYLRKRAATEKEIISITTENASRTTVRNILTSESRDLRSRAATIQAILNNLYAQNVLHVRFRNMMAVNQLLEYLEMGVCTELEGPNGAYAQYLNDLRTEKICGSIQQLEETMKQGFSSMAAMMGRLSAQLEHTNQQIHGLGNAISSDLARIERGITTHNTEMSAALRDINSQAERIAASTGDLAVTAKTAAWNEYVTSLESGVRGYMLRRPH